MSRAGPAVTVIIPTLRRPAGLAKAVESLFAQKDLGSRSFHILVVDNDPDGAAAGICRELAVAAPSHIHLRYVAEPEPGVANARNAGLAAAETRLIAFLDDDQSAAPGWLAGLLAFHTRCPAAVTFGPVETALPPGSGVHSAYFNAFFARTAGATSGHIDTWYGCGNSLFDLDFCPLERPVFDTKTNETGGEDDMAFSAIHEAGGRFAWCAEAPVTEHVTAARARLGYTLRRAYAYGQGPSTLAWRRRAYGRLFGWMLVGAGQTGLFGTVSALQWVMRRPGRAHWYDRTARGLGKLFWFHAVRFYGTASLHGRPTCAATPTPESLGHTLLTD